MRHMSKLDYSKCPKCGTKLERSSYKLTRCSGCGWSPGISYVGVSFPIRTEFDPDNPIIVSPSLRGHLTHEIR